MPIPGLGAAGMGWWLWSFRLIFLCGSGAVCDIPPAWTLPFPGEFSKSRSQGNSAPASTGSQDFARSSNLPAQPQCPTV